MESKEPINIFNWFEFLNGFNEKLWDYTMESLNPVVQEGSGSFTEISIEKLKEKIRGSKFSHIHKLNVLMRGRKTEKNEHMFDTSSLQFNALPNSLFQVASNFNCLELSSPHKNPFAGTYITQLMYDLTQGPSAAGGAVFGSILRLVKHKNDPIDLLSDTPFTPTNGKLYNVKNDMVSKFNIDAIKIGLHTGVRASFNRASNKFEYSITGTKIDQVFTSTCIFSNPKDSNTKLAEILLEKAYEGVYLAGILRRSPRIYLTLIGGGSFDNPMSLIIRKMLEVHEKYSVFLPEDCEVILPIYESSRVDIEKLLKVKDWVNIKWI
jgi:hypothetical protein